MSITSLVGYFGDVGVKPDITGISGKKVVLRIEKRFNRLERILARLFRTERNKETVGYQK